MARPVLYLEKSCRIQYQELRGICVYDGVPQKYEINPDGACTSGNY